MVTDGWFVCIAACAASGALYALITWVTGCGCLYSCCYRSKMRRQYALEESSCGDCMVHCCCEQCALCQEYRELKHQGFDLSIGKNNLLFSLSHKTHSNYIHLNTYFQFLNNIICIFTHFFTHTYFHTFFQIQIFSF